MVISAVSTVLMNNTFANLPAAAVDFFEGVAAQLEPKQIIQKDRFRKTFSLKTTHLLTARWLKRTRGQQTTVQ